MIKSMTAYGRAEASSSLGRLVIEIQSLNRKYLEISTNLPKGFVSIDVEIKKIIRKSLSRGHINVFLSLYLDQGQTIEIAPNLSLAKGIHKAWDSVCKELNIKNEDEAYQLGLSRLLTQDTTLFHQESSLEKSEDFHSLLQEVVALSLTSLDEMRIKEGKAIEEDIIKRLKLLESYIKEIEKIAPSQVTIIREKLQKNLELFFENKDENEERILREIVLYADKLDISEEITRFYSHLNQYADLLRRDQKGIGKTLDFVVKEMHRELHTMGAKVNLNEMALIIIDAKTEVEKIREQIQNIE